MKALPNKNAIVIRKNPSFLDLTIGTAEGLIFLCSVLVGVVSGTISSMVFDSWNPAYMGAASSLTFFAVSYMANSLTQTAKFYRSLGAIPYHPPLSILLHRKTVIADYIVSAPNPVTNDAFYLNRFHKTNPFMAHNCQLSAIWTWKGLAVEQVLTPTAETLWDKSLETVTKMYPKKVGSGKMNAEKL